MCGRRVTKRLIGGVLAFMMTLGQAVVFNGDVVRAEDGDEEYGPPIAVEMTDMPEDTLHSEASEDTIDSDVPYDMLHTETDAEDMSIDYEGEDYAPTSGKIMTIPEDFYKGGQDIYSEDSGSCIYTTYSSMDSYAIKSFDINTGEVTTIDIPQEQDYGYGYNVFSANNKLYISQSYMTYDYDENRYLYEHKIYELDMSEGSLAEKCTLDYDGYLYSFCVDDKENFLFRCDGGLALFNSSGALVSEVATNTAIYSLCGMDSASGNFFYLSSTNWRYWGYDHDMTCLKAGNIKDGVLTLTDKSMSILFQSYFFEHVSPVQMLSNGKVSMLTTFSGENAIVLNPDKYDVNDVTDSTTTISLIDSGVSVTTLCIENTAAVAGSYKTADSIYENDVDVSSVGTRVVYDKTNGGYIVKTGSNELTEYKEGSTAVYLKGQTKYPVYTMTMKQGKLVVVEKDDSGKFYLEKFDWIYATSISISGATSLQIGQSEKYTYSVKGVAPSIKFSSSDNKVISIDEEGYASANSSGKATITVSDAAGKLKSSIVVTVSGKKLSASKEAIRVSGVKQDSYFSECDFFQTSSGEYVRVELYDSNATKVYTISGGTVKSTKSIPKELSYSIAFYNGKDNYFIVYGDDNREESDQKEVLRIVKYSKNWERLGACSIKGSNTIYPGSTADMDETSDRLYLHTCHTMYKSNDGYNHQANMTFDIKKSNMTLNSSYYGVMNLGVGYVSHSFQQFVKVDGDNVYRIDRGDAYPRGEAFTMIKVGDTLGSQCRSYGTLLQYKGEIGENNTYSALGGLDFSDRYIVTTGTYSNYDADRYTRNVYVTGLKKDMSKNDVYFLTDYKDSKNAQGDISTVLCSNPYLVKFSNNTFVIMWNERKVTYKNGWDAQYGNISLKYAFLDQAGKKISDIYSANCGLMDDQPFLDKDGYICWSVTDNKGSRICYMDPYSRKAYTTPVSVSYRTHVQSVGWQGFVSDGAMAGTSGKAKRLEGIEIKISGSDKLGIMYTTHCQTYGWLPWSRNGEMNGTEGEAKRLEAIKICLTGTSAKNYDVYYRVHAQTYGWLGWVKNGEASGTAGLAKRLEGIQVVIVPKGSGAPGNIGGIKSTNAKGYIYDTKNGNTSPVLGYKATTITNPDIPGTDVTNVAYRTHVQSIGWQGWKYNGAMSGTSGMAKRLEGIDIKLTNKQYNGGVTYRTHVQSFGWETEWKKDGGTSGTVGKAKRLEAIQINLHGEMAEHYDIYYRVHAQNYGWLGWTYNGRNAGTAGYAKRLEGIQIVLVEKGKAGPGKTYGGITSDQNAAYIEK